MSNERSALIHTIAERPDDDVARLVFADWLQEHGEEPLAPYIRASVHAAQKAYGSPERIEDEITAEHQFQAHQAMWEGVLDLPEGARLGRYTDRGYMARESDGWERGLPSEFSVTEDFFLSPAMDELRERFPITMVHINDLSAKNARKIVDRLSALDIPGLGLHALDTIENPAGNPRLSAIIEQIFSRNAISHLTRLDLSHNHLEEFPEAVHHIADAAPQLSNLTSLNLGYNGLGTNLYPFVNAAHYFTHLDTLNLAGNNIHESNAFDSLICMLRPLTALTTLDISQNHLGSSAHSLAPLQQCFKNLPALTNLNLADNQLSSSDNHWHSVTSALAECKFLRTLNLSQNSYSDPFNGDTALATRGALNMQTLCDALHEKEGLTQLTSLNLANNTLSINLGDSALPEIHFLRYLPRFFSHIPELRRLNLNNIDLGLFEYHSDAVRRAFTHLPALRSLSVSHNSLGEFAQAFKLFTKGLASLTHLDHLDMHNNMVGNNEHDTELLHDALRNTKTLHTLDLQGNNVGSNPDDINQLANLLEHNKTIARVDVRGNEIGEHVMRTILQNNGRLDDVEFPGFETLQEKVRAGRGRAVDELEP